MTEVELDVPIDALTRLIQSDDNSVKTQCLEYVKLLTGNTSKCKELYQNAELLSNVIKAVLDIPKLSKLSLETLINVASIEDGAKAIFDCDLESTTTSNPTLILFDRIVDKNNPLAEYASNVLTNMTVWEFVALKVAKTLLDHKEGLPSLFDAVCNKNFNPACPNLSQHLCQLFGNLTQSKDFQEYLITAEGGNLFCSLLSIINSGETVIQKTGILSALHNCLFNSEHHSSFLGAPFDILGTLLYPLAGPEEFDEEDEDKLPIEVQYLGTEKERENDPQIRKLVLQSLLLLCDTKKGRIFLRDHQTYLILREYHKWEKDPSLILACENVVDVLIRTEEEIGVDNLKNVEVPEDLKEKFQKMDDDFIKD